jgi:hypothetical protein
MKDHRYNKYIKKIGIIDINKKMFILKYAGSSLKRWADFTSSTGYNKPKTLKRTVKQILPFQQGKLNQRLQFIILYFSILLHYIVQ